MKPPTSLGLIWWCFMCLIKYCHTYVMSYILLFFLSNHLWVYVFHDIHSYSYPHPVLDDSFRCLMSSHVLSWQDIIRYRHTNIIVSLSCLSSWHRSTAMTAITYAYLCYDVDNLDSNMLTTYRIHYHMVNLDTTIWICVALLLS